MQSEIVLFLTTHSEHDWSLQLNTRMVNGFQYMYCEVTWKSVRVVEIVQNYSVVRVSRLKQYCYFTIYGFSLWLCGIQQTIFATTDFPAMPQKFTQCKLCKKRVTCSNIWRHDARKYGYHNGQQKIRDLSLESLASRDVNVTRSSVTPETGQVIDSDSERCATLCMLRPVERVNLPNLSRYLEILSRNSGSIQGATHSMHDVARSA